jgi:hypothetical protein
MDEDIYDFGDNDSLLWGDQFIHGVVLGGTSSLDKWKSSIRIQTSYLNSTGT